MKEKWFIIRKEGSDVILDSCDKDAAGEIVIPDGVTKIEDYAFDDCEKVASLTIPSSIQAIGTGAFDGCTNLKSIIVDSSNAIYDSRNNCNAIIETATNTLIKGCQNTVIPDDVKSIGDCAFVGCSPLTSINLPNGLEEIGVCAFAGTGLTTIVFPPSLKSIDVNAFGVCLGLTNLNVPYGVTYISGDAFWGCRNLVLIRLPESAMPEGGILKSVPAK